MNRDHSRDRPADRADAAASAPASSATSAAASAFTSPLPELRLARIPAASRSLYLGDRWSYLEAGDADAPPIVLLHGIGAHAAYFRFQLAALAPCARVLAWNAPGYMLSDALRSSTPQAEDYAQAVHDFLDATGVQRCLLAGHSFGSAVAQAFAIAHPHRVSGLLLSGTGVGQRTVSPERRAAYEERVQRLRKGGFQYGDPGSDALVSRTAPSVVRALATELARALRPEGVERAAAFRLSSFYSPDLADRLDMPVLLVQGEEDRINPREHNAGLLLPVLARGAMQVWPGVGHLPELEAADRYNATLLAFARECGQLPA